MKKAASIVMSLFLMITVLAACGSNNANDKSSNNGGSASNAPAATDAPENNEKNLKIALVLPEPIGVNPFWALMDEGLKRGGEEFGVEVRTIESTDPAGFEQNLRATVAENYDLIITASFQATDALTKVANENPDKSFALIDEYSDLPNVRSVVFREHEAAYLLGAAAGLSTKTNTVGAVVAMEIPLMKKYTEGFNQGLLSVNPEAKFLIHYVNSFNDPAKGKELALLQNSQGADFVAGMAATSDLGVFEAAKEKGFYTSGQDVDRTNLDPEHIVLSQLKGTDAVAYETVKSFAEGSFEFGTFDYGVAEGAVGLTFVTHESESPLSDFVGQANVDQLKTIAEDIKSGKIVVNNPLAE